MTNPYRKSTAEDLELARRERIRRETLSPELQLEERLADLETFIRQLAHTPHGKADLKRRVQRFGNCAPVAGESQRHYYGKLRDWLDRECEESCASVSSSMLT